MLNKLFDLFAELEVLNAEIENGRKELQAHAIRINEEIDALIDEIIAKNPSVTFHGSNIVREAYKIVYMTRD